MLKKRFRLHTSEFKEVFNFGKTLKNDLFLIKTKQNNLPYSRFAVVVSKKISKKAVERKYIKRRCMNAIKEGVKSKVNSDYICILNAAIKDIQYKDLLNNLEKLSL